MSNQITVIVVCTLNAATVPQIHNHTVVCYVQCYSHFQTLLGHCVSIALVHKLITIFTELRIVSGSVKFSLNVCGYIRDEVVVKV